MKKRVAAIFMTAVVAFSMAACGSIENNGNSGNKDASVSEKEEPAEKKEDLEEITISFAVFHNESSLDATEFVAPWLDEISARCAEVGYDLNFDVYYGETLCSNPETYQTVMEGAVDMGMFLTPLAAQFDLDEVMMFGQNGKTVYRPSRIYQDLYNEFEEIQAEWADVHVIGMVMETPQYTMTNAQFSNMKESKGIKWNTTGAICSNILDKFGWASISCGPTDVYTYGERGMIDGCGTSAKNIMSNAWYEVFDYVYNIVITNMTESIIMNQDVWDSLPADVQSVFNDMGLGSGEYILCDMYDEALSKIEAEYWDKLINEYGMEWVELPDDVLTEYQNCIDAVAAEWAEALDAKGQPGSDLLNKYYELSEKYSAEEYSWE